MMRWIIAVKLIGLVVLGAATMGTMTACGTVEGIGKDISAVGRAGKRAFD